MNFNQSKHLYLKRSRKYKNSRQGHKKTICFFMSIFILFFVNSSILLTQASSLLVVGSLASYKFENGNLMNLSFNKDLNQQNIQVIHKVMPGETLFSIARKHYNSTEFVQKLEQDNNIKNPSQDLKVGNPLIIINPKIIDIYKVNSGDTIFSITQQYFNREWYTSCIQSLNGIHNPNTDVKAGMKILLPLTESTTKYTVQPGETLYRIVLKHYQSSLFQELIIKYNGISPTSLKIGTEIKIPNPFYMKKDMVKENITQEKYDYYIEINKSKNTLSLFKNKKLVDTFQVATGKNADLTPVGTFEIVNKIQDPWYSPKGIAGKDPQNPLGTRWLGLSVPDTGGTKYGIHGTNNPSSIGKYASLGCIRMNNKDVQQLYDHIPIGTVVVIKK
jgi:lipoprotein-anchoring transpeptidase ErfK/SrfK